MTHPVPMVEIWRGPFQESVHTGHAVICDANGEIVEAWGDPDRILLSRSASKMIQALPLIESGAADAHNLTPAHLALACASHSGMTLHTRMVRNWLNVLELTDSDLRCGAHFPYDRDTEVSMIAKGETPCQYHNNCSGKHSGFLTLTKHLRAGPDYIDPDHPVQQAVRDAYARTTNEDPTGFGIDGCSAPNFATTLHGMARAMAHFASSPEDSAEARLHRAMRAHPEYVAGTGRACTELMRAAGGKIAIKTGAEGVYNAILPDQKLGITLKITDGTTRASECAMAALLVKLGVLDNDHPAVAKVLNAPITNRRNIQTGWLRAAPPLI
ncbi:MAG: asparaginase [Pseudomonadota bacterium]